MPTGYTANVADGTITEFGDFAMLCARAFGACVSMRDSPHDAQIPDVFQPSDYNSKELCDAESELRRLESMSETDRVEAAEADYASQLTAWQKYHDDMEKKKSRYEAMLAKVTEWQPPTVEHSGLKKFMSEQLENSIMFDCGNLYVKKPERGTVYEWYSRALETANKNIAYHAKAQAEEIERARTRSKWVADLRASLVLKPTAA